MARPLRIQYPDAMYMYHFMERVFDKYNRICHAWGLMQNHYHSQAQKRLKGEN
jgi:hypothetical protein